MPKIVARKIDINTHGPSEFAICSDQQLLELGYKWDFNVYYRNGICYRSGLSKAESYAELIAFIESGMSNKEWLERKRNA